MRNTSTKNTAYSGLHISQPLCILQLGSQAGLVLAELDALPLSLLQVVGEVAALHGHLLLAGISLIESTGNILKPMNG